MSKTKPTPPKRKKAPVSSGIKGKLLPIIPLKDIVVFPNCITPLFVMRPKSLAALEEAVDSNKRIFLVTQKVVDIENPEDADLYTYGTMAEVLQVLKMPDGAAKVLVEGQEICEVLRYEHDDRLTRAEIIPFQVKDSKRSDKIEALLRVVLNQFETYVKLFDKIPDELYLSIKNYEDPVQIANTISHYANFKTYDKQQILESESLSEKLLLLNRFLNVENELLELEGQIMSQVRNQIGKSQKEYFLNEQLKVIEKELGLNGEDDMEIEEFSDKIERGNLSEDAREKVTRELNRLSKMAPMSPEATVSRTYIEWILDLPWGVRTKDKKDINAAQEVLDADHYGLTKVKDRIVEFLAVHQLTADVKGPILCLVGPPGVGKTSLARSIASSLGRKFVRISLGGVRDEAEIRGHRRTYIGSLPGKIIQAMKKAESSNPVILLDEIDKMASDFRGDPASALLEVLDPEQNKTFADHYLEVEYDLSDVFFVTTANTRSGIPYPLLDRMELINLAGYTEDEKLEIADRYLVQKQIGLNGLKDISVDFTRPAIEFIVNSYTREAGVRNLERQIATVCRRIAKEYVKNNNDKAKLKKTKSKTAPSKKKSAPIKVTPEKVRQLLGPVKFKDTVNNKKPEVGVTTGLAWTEVGGELLPAEATVMKGSGNLVLTGHLGDVMKESAKAALSYIRTRYAELNIPDDFHKNFDIHIHFPEGAIPKDGPSAGVTMTTSLVSALTNRPVRQDVAMTGEITLRGKVLKIGGLKEKVLAAHRAHIREVVIPRENEDDLEEISKSIRGDMKFHLADTIDQVLKIMLLDDKKSVKKIPTPPARSGRTTPTRKTRTSLRK